MEKRTKRVTKAEQELEARRKGLRSIADREAALTKLTLTTEAGSKAKDEELMRLSTDKTLVTHQIIKLEEELELAIVAMAAGSDTNFVEEIGRNHGHDLRPSGD